MSDIYNNIAGFKTFEKPVCRVAYTLNNTQPVVCTIIDDHPLFYMDFESNGEDDLEYFDAAELSILEGELENLKKEMTSLELPQAVSRSSEEKVHEFFTDKEDILSLAPGKPASLAKIEAALSKSRLGSAFLDFAQEHGVVLKISNQVSTACYDRNSGTILINGSIDFADQLLLTARELRRHWQHRQGALINPVMFHPDNAVLVNRVQVADLVSSMVRIAWELQLSGEKAPWETLENSTMEDLTRAFSREAYLDFRTINNGQAMAAVFEAWFLSERPRAEDKTLINQMLADHTGMVFELDQNDQTVTPQLISALGEMPFGKNYLAEHAITIMDDAIFTDIRDRANANFLWFIKFERSFRETEHELQTSQDPSAGNVHSNGLSKTQDPDCDVAIQAPEAAEVIQLFANPAKTGDKSAKTPKRLSPRGRKTRNQVQDDTTNVVYLRRWTAE